jgi:signal transduction histidine kinase
VLGAATDITERRHMEEMLRQREQDLCAALEERQRISEDLHDGILQSIYAVGLGLESCKMLVSAPPRQRKEADTQLLATFERAIGQLSHLMAEVRNFIAGLESKVLQGVDFASALRAMVQTMSASSHSKCKAVIDEAAARQFSTEQALHLMNLVREALSNSLRHSEARNVTVSLKRLRRSVRLSVIDDGIGFTQTSVGDAGHGLANMAARARKLGGRLNVCSRPRRGTKVLLDIPRRSADE